MWEKKAELDKSNPKKVSRKRERITVTTKKKKRATGSTGAKKIGKTK